jgi:hypothetical protein
MTEHQFSLFRYNDLKPKIKIPISAARIRQAKAEYKAGNYANSIILLRDVREKLEAFEERLTNRINNGHIR